MNNLIKSGLFQILSKNHYKDYYDFQEGKLLKITKIADNHNEFQHLSLIRTIDNYSKYYCIPDELSYLLQPSSPFYEKLKEFS